MPPMIRLLLLEGLLGLAAISLVPGLATQAHAGDGHDHGDAPKSAAGPAQPRFSAVSELFELVGVLANQRLTLYLDRAADNSPVPDARLALEIDGRKIAVTQTAAGEFEATLPEAPKAGVSAVTATIEADGEVDLLAADLDVHVDAHAHDEPTGDYWSNPRTLALLGAVGVAGVLGLLAATWTLAVRSTRRRLSGEPS